MAATYPTYADFGGHGRQWEPHPPHAWTPMGAPVPVAVLPDTVPAVPSTQHFRQQPAPYAMEAELHRLHWHLQQEESMAAQMRLDLSGGVASLPTTSTTLPCGSATTIALPQGSGPCGTGYDLQRHQPQREAQQPQQYQPSRTVQLAQDPFLTEGCAPACGSSWSSTRASPPATGSASLSSWSPTRIAPPNTRAFGPDGKDFEQHAPPQRQELQPPQTMPLSAQLPRESAVDRLVQPRFQPGVQQHQQHRHSSELTLASRPEEALKRHREAAERSKELYLSGKLEGFEVLRPDCVFPSADQRERFACSQQARDLRGASQEARPKLFVRVLAGYNLRNRDTGLLGDVSDPYVAVRLGKAQHRTETIDNDLNPKWVKQNEFSFIVGDQDGVLELEVLNSNVFSDNSLGSIRIALWSLLSLDGQWQRRKDRLEDGRGGELEFEVCFQVGDTAGLTRSLTADAHSPAVSSRAGAEPSKDDLGVLHLRVLSARKLKNRDANVVGDVSDPYVAAKLGITEKRTPTMPNTLNPVWDSGNSFSFPVRRGDEALELRVLNSNAMDTSFGRLRIPVRDVPAQWRHRQEKLLEAGSKKSEIEIEVRYDRADGSADVAVQREWTGGADVEDPQQELERLYAELHYRMAAMAAGGALQGSPPETPAAVQPAPSAKTSRSYEGELAAPTPITPWPKLPSTSRSSDSSPPPSQALTVRL